MGQKGVDQGSAGISHGRVDHHARRLVDHNHVAIFVEDDQRDLFRFRHCGGRRRHRHHHPLATPELERRLLDAIVHRHPPLFDEALGRRTGYSLDRAGHELVEPFRFTFRRHRQIVSLPLSLHP